jgi:D-alanyl-D-alanine carboxypeptidase
MTYRSWGRGGRRTAVTLAVAALLAAAFLAGVVVGSAQAAASRARTAAADAGTWAPNQPRADDLTDVSLPSSPAPQSSAVPQELNDLPACVFADAPRRSDPWRGWSSLVLDTATALRPDDVPPDLVDTARAGLNGGHLVRAIVIDDLRAMARAARRSDAGLAIQSAYRSYAEQADTFGYWVAVAGRHQALGRSARPGHSEHQLGTTIDFMSTNGGAPWHGSDWGHSAAGKWLMRHAWQYGFVLSYPRGARDVTCYAYEPWHYRYLGRPIAAAIHASGMAPRDWLLRP